MAIPRFVIQDFNISEFVPVLRSLPMNLEKDLDNFKQLSHIFCQLPTSYSFTFLTQNTTVEGGFTSPLSASSRNARRVTLRDDPANSCVGDYEFARGKVEFDNYRRDAAQYIPY